MRFELNTIDIMTTHGRLREVTISRAKDVFPEPELPAMPIMLVSAPEITSSQKCFNLDE